jgi:hypothetical protein
VTNMPDGSETIALQVAGAHRQTRKFDFGKV